MLNKIDISNFWLDVFVGWRLARGRRLSSNHFWLLERALELSTSNQMSRFRIFYNFHSQCLSEKNTAHFALYLGSAILLVLDSCLYFHWWFWLSEITCKRWHMPSMAKVCYGWRNSAMHWGDSHAWWRCVAYVTLWDLHTVRGSGWPLVFYFSLSSMALKWKSLE